IRDVETNRLGAAQTIGVDRLEHLRVPQRSQRALPPLVENGLNPRVCSAEEPLEFVIGERPALRPPFVVDEVCGGVPLMAYLLRCLAEPAFALGHPFVAPIAKVF